MIFFLNNIEKVKLVFHHGNGFFVKMTNADAKDYSMIMQLSKAEKQTFPASMFKIPNGYTESKTNLIFGNMMKDAPKK